MRTYYRKTYEIVGWTFNADIYCAGCGENLPTVDRDGNEKHPVFLDDVDGLAGHVCGGCHTACVDW